MGGEGRRGREEGKGLRRRRKLLEENEVDQ